LCRHTDRKKNLVFILQFSLIFQNTTHFSRGDILQGTRRCGARANNSNEVEQYHLIIARDHAIVYWTGPCGCLLQRTIRLYRACLLYAVVYCLQLFIVCDSILYAVVYRMRLLLRLFIVRVIAILAHFSKHHSFL
jgi:hypothetical protein